MDHDAGAQRQRSETTAAKSASMSPERHKHWGERSIEEKLEALRAEVIRLVQLNRIQEEQLSDLRQHQHGMSGQMVKPINADRLHPSAEREAPYALSIRD